MPKPLNTTLCTLAASLLCSSAAWGQTTIYRCGNSYSQTPCPQARTLPPEPAPSAADKAAHDQRTARDARLADTMAQQRRKEEAAALEAARNQTTAPAKAEPSPAGHAQRRSQLTKPATFTVKIAAPKKAARKKKTPPPKSPD